MRLYKVSAPTLKPSTMYVGSEREAASARKAFIGQGAHRAEIMTAEVDVPTDKPGLIAFLNKLVA